MEASVIVRSDCGSAAMWSWLLANHTLDQKPCGKVAIAESAIAPASPNGMSNAIQPMIAEMIATASIVRTAPTEKADKRELTSKRKTMVETLINGLQAA